MTPVSVLPLQILIFFDNLYSVFYFLVELSLYVYKGYSLNYPSGSIGSEIIIMFIFAAVQFFRLYIGSVGNKAEKVEETAWFIGLCFPTILACVYYIQLQTYVLVAELILNVIFLVFMILELLLALYAVIKFKSAEKDR